MKEQHLKTTHENLLKLLTSKKSALPTDFNQTRFIQNCMVVLQDTKDIEKVEPVSVARTMLKGAFLGLDFFNKECYAIAYGNTLQFQTDYKGEKKIVKKYSINPITDIYAKLVREGDIFEESIVNGKQTINFVPLPFNNEEIIGVFAVALFKDNAIMYETMSTEDINKVRADYSKQAGGKAWIKSWGEMAKKTVLRRLCKHIEIDFDTIEQQKTWDASGDCDFSKQTHIPASSLDNVIEVEVKQVKDKSNEVNPK